MDAGVTVFVVCLVGGYVGYKIYEFTRPDQICIKCHSIGKPKQKTQGNILIEIVLWLCLIIPGLVYSLWRLSAKKKVCPRCGAADMVPMDTPAAQKILATNNPASVDNKKTGTIEQYYQTLNE